MKTKLPWIAENSKSSNQISKLLGERDWCYFIPPQHGEKGFIPACVIERVQGYRMMQGNSIGSAPWYWGKTESEANEICKEANNRLGIEPKRAQEIVLSTMCDFEAAKSKYSKA